MAHASGDTKFFRKTRQAFAAFKKPLAPLLRNMRDELCIILPNYTPKDEYLVI